jgi:uncharacterized phage protein gp47/JayE
MPFPIPSLPALLTRARNAFRANLPGTDAWLWPNNVNPFAKVLSGLMFELFGFLDNIAKQRFAITAEGEYLDRHGAEIGLGRNQPSPSTGPVLITVADAYKVASGARFQRSDGFQFAATAAVSTLTAGTLSVPVQATAPGSAGNTIAGASLQILSGVTDVNGDANAVTAVGTAGIGGGADIELDGVKYNPPPGTYRYRILFKKRNPPQGGAPADYVTWAMQVPGVTRVFVERQWAGAGTVRVFPLMDNTYPNGIPQTSDINNIANYIATVAPGDAVITVQAPTALPVNVTVQGLSPSSAATQSAIEEELAAAFLRLSAVAGNDAGNPAMPFLAVPSTFALSWIERAVADATGVSRGNVTAPIADVGLSAGQIATPGTLNFT